MNRNELLNLPEGKYLMTDEIMNYRYILWRFKKEHRKENDSNLIGFLYDYHSYMGTPWSPHIAIFYSEKDLEVDWSYDKLKVYNFSAMSGVGGINVRGDFYKGLSDLKLVCKFNRETFVDDLKKFQVHWWINLPANTKRRKRKEKLTKI